MKKRRGKTQGKPRRPAAKDGDGEEGRGGEGW